MIVRLLPTPAAIGSYTKVNTTGLDRAMDAAAASTGVVKATITSTSELS